MTMFRCRACPVKDERLQAMSESHVREIATLKATHDAETAFLRGTVEALSNKLMATLAPHSYAVMQPRAERNPENDKAPGSHSPSLIRQRRQDKPTPQEIEALEARVRRAQEQARADDGMPVAQANGAQG